MVRTIVKSSTLTIDGRTYRVRYYEARTARGSRRYSAEIIFGPTDRIIIDDDTIARLEARAMRVVPATLYSRMLAGKATAA